MNGFTAIVLATREQVPDEELLLRLVGGVPLLLRTFLALQRAGCTRLLFLGDGPADSFTQLESDKRLKMEVEWHTAETIDDAAVSDESVAIVPANVVFDYQLLRDLECPDAMEVRVFGDTGIYLVGAQAIDRILKLRSFASLSEVGQSTRLEVDRYWHRIGAFSEIRPAEKKIYHSLADNEGGLEGILDHVITRRFSIMLTRMLIPFPISPNLVTVVSFLTGLVALYYFSLPGYMNKVWGALLLHVSNVIDHSDGEIARLKFQMSRFGGMLDLLLDQVVYSFLMLAIGIGVAADLGQTYFWLGAACAFGSFMGCVYTTINQLFETRTLALVANPDEEVVGSESLFTRMIQTFGTREFGYYLLFVTLIDKLNWLLWVFAIGVQFFWIILTILYLTEHRKSKKSSASG